jgi:hypothetical protein
VQNLECYILQWLASSNTSSHSQVLHDESGTHSEVPLKIQTAVGAAGSLLFICCNHPILKMKQAFLTSHICTP